MLDYDTGETAPYSRARTALRLSACGPSVISPKVIALDERHAHLGLTGRDYVGPSVFQRLGVPPNVCSAQKRAMLDCSFSLAG